MAQPADVEVRHFVLVPGPGGAAAGAVEIAAAVAVAPPVAAAPGPVPDPRVRPAATVMMIDAQGRVFTFRRRSTMVFAPGMVVFPGGRCEDADADLAARTGMLPAAVAAVRETLEECGVLLARGDVDPAALAVQRRRLAAGADLASVLDALGAHLDPGLLHPWARRVTPVAEVRRYDTMFFLAALPPGQRSGPLDSEGEAGEWLAPAEALARHRAGELPMMPPTLVAMEELAAADLAAGDVGRLFAVRRRLDPVRPEVLTGPDGRPVLRAVLPVQPVPERGRA